jgi:hypothetical protein
MDWPTGTRGILDCFRKLSDKTMCDHLFDFGTNEHGLRSVCCAVSHSFCVCGRVAIDSQINIALVNKFINQ